MSALDSFFEKIATLPMMPKVIQEVVALLENDDVDIDSVVKKISLDQVLSAKVLRLSNSSYYGRSGNVKTLNEAISVTGMQNLKTLVIASGITAAFSKLDGIDLQPFWESSLVTANLSRQISREKKLNTEVSYLAGLMHSIGQLPIYMVYPTEALEIDELAKGVSAKARTTIELDKLSVDHSMIGAELARRWNFPEEIQHAIQYYVNPLDVGACDTAPVVNLATCIAAAVKTSSEHDAILASIDDDLLAKIDIDRDDLEENLEKYQALIAEVATAL